MMKSKIAKLVAVVLAFVFAFLAMAPVGTVEAAPPPSYDGEGNPVEPPPFVLTEVELPSRTSIDDEMNSSSAGIRKLIAKDGWLLRGVDRHNDGLERVYTFERYTDMKYQTDYFLLYQKDNRFSLDGERYRSQFHVSLLYLFGCFEMGTYIY
jgi:hypothetical protein